MAFCILFETAPSLSKFSNALLYCSFSLLEKLKSKSFFFNLEATLKGSIESSISLVIAFPTLSNCFLFIGFLPFAQEI